MFLRSQMSKHSTELLLKGFTLTGQFERPALLQMASFRFNWKTKCYKHKHLQYLGGHNCAHVRLNLLYGLVGLYAKLRTGTEVQLKHQYVCFQPFSQHSYHLKDQTSVLSKKYLQRSLFSALKDISTKFPEKFINI